MPEARFPVGATTQRVDWLARLKQAREEERLRISRLLHDDVGQVLSAVGLQIELLRMDCAQVRDVAGRILEIQKLLHRAVEQVRELSYDLNPAIVERMGLEAALSRLVQRCRGEFRGDLRWSFQGDAQARTVQAQVLYRIAEQALDNAVRHSGATEIELLVQAGPNGLRLELRDNGRGFAYPQVLEESPATGLRMMEREAETAGLEFRLASESEKGTIVTAWWPPSSGRSVRKRVGRRRPAKPGGKR